MAEGESSLDEIFDGNDVPTLLVVVANKLAKLQLNGLQESLCI